MKTIINWEKDIWESIEEKDVILLRFRINDIHNMNKKNLSKNAMKNTDEKDIKA